MLKFPCDQLITFKSTGTWDTEFQGKYHMEKRNTSHLQKISLYFESGESKGYMVDPIRLVSRMASNEQKLTKRLPFPKVESIIVQLPFLEVVYIDWGD